MPCRVATRPTNLREASEMSNPYADADKKEGVGKSLLNESRSITILYFLFGSRARRNISAWHEKRKFSARLAPTLAKRVFSGNCQYHALAFQAADDPGLQIGHKYAFLSNKQVHIGKI